jgi:hypothetical protein
MIYDPILTKKMKEKKVLGFGQKKNSNRHSIENSMENLNDKQARFKRKRKRSNSTRGRSKDLLDKAENSNSSTIVAAN